jgi:hypothetical protein
VPKGVCCGLRRRMLPMHLIDARSSCAKTCCARPTVTSCSSTGCCASIAGSSIAASTSYRRRSILSAGSTDCAQPKGIDTGWQRSRGLVRFECDPKELQRDSHRSDVNGVAVDGREASLRRLADPRQITAAGSSTHPWSCRWNPRRSNAAPPSFRQSPPGEESSE